MISLSWPGGSPENTALIIGIVFAAYVGALWFAAVVWTARDINARAADPITQVVAVLLVLLFNFPGLVLYFVLRPTRTLEEAFEHQLEEETLLHELRGVLRCPQCDGHVEQDYLVCPRCAAPLRISCAGCERPLESDWAACPWCGERIPRAPAGAPPPEPAPEDVPAPEEQAPPTPSDQPFAEQGG